MEYIFSKAQIWDGFRISESSQFRGREIGKFCLNDVNDPNESESQSNAESDVQQFVTFLKVILLMEEILQHLGWKNPCQFL